MRLGARIFNILTEDTDVSALIDTRATPGLMPEGSVVPACVYTIVSNMPLVTLSDQNGVRNAHIQIDCYAKHYADVQQLADAVEAAFAGVNATPYPVSTPRRRMDMYDDVPEYYRCLLEFSYWTDIDQ